MSRNNFIISVNIYAYAYIFENYAAWDEDRYVQQNYIPVFNIHILMPPPDVLAHFCPHMSPKKLHIDGTLA